MLQTLSACPTLLRLSSSSNCIHVYALVFISYLASLELVPSYILSLQMFVFVSWCYGFPTFLRLFSPVFNSSYPRSAVMSYSCFYPFVGNEVGIHLYQFKKKPISALSNDSNDSSGLIVSND